MGVENLLNSRAIIGEFYRRLAISTGSWARQVGMYFSSVQETETYPWLGQVPGMRQWIGPRLAKGLWDNKLTVTNQPYESTLKVAIPDMRRDRTGQIQTRVGEQVRRADTHWNSLLSTLILAGTSTHCYDGQFFFDTDHTEGNNTTNQSNDLSIDISSLPVPSDEQGTTTNPSSHVLSLVILLMIQAIMGFKDNENEPMNEDATEFLVMVPVSLWAAALGAVNSISFGSGATNTLRTEKFNVNVVANARLTWTTSLACFRTDGDVRPFILQEEKPVSMSVLAEGSDHAFKENEYLFGIDASRAVEYGYWQHACFANMT